MANCPICGRHISEFTNDPLLSTPSLSTAQFEGFTQLITTHIIELQTERHQQEIDNGVTPLTVFSPVNDTGLFQNIKQYVLELRSSTQKILDVTGMSLHDFLSTDEDGNPMTSKDNWTDSNLEETKYQCKAIHIEDLRHFIQSVGFRENWESSIPNIYTVSSSFEGQDTKFWNVDLYGCATGSFVQITALKDMILQGRPTDGAGGDTNPTIAYGSAQYFAKKFKFPLNGKLYFDVNGINITKKNAFFAGYGLYSLDNVSIQISLRTYLDSYYYPLIYYFNTNENFLAPPFELLYYSLLKGDLSVGSYMYDTWNDLITIYNGGHSRTSLINYYNGILDTRGAYIDGVLIGVGNTGVSPYYMQMIELDNIKIAV